MNTAECPTQPAAAAIGLPDPLQYGVPLPYEATFYPMGLPVHLRTNSEDVLAAAAESWDQFESVHDTAPVEIILAVAAGTSVRPDPAPLPFGQGHLITIVHSAGNFAVTDVDRGFAWGWLTSDIAADHGYCRYHFLEPLAYLTLTCLYLAPVHSACAALDGRAMVFCGDSGSGKTSLVYTLARSGWTYISDDASYLRRPNARCVFGKPHHIRFRSSAQSLFRELASHTPVRRPNGKLDIELSTAEIGFSSIAVSAEPERLIFLKREEGTLPSLSPVSRQAVEAQLLPVACYGPERVREEQRAVLREFASLPAFQLTYWDLARAEHFLRDLIRKS